MDSGSMFSMQTVMTTAKGKDGKALQIRNDLHTYFYSLLPQLSQQYPFLARIFFLQLVLRENVLIYTEDRVDARDIWLSIARRLQLPRPDLYVVDDKMDIDAILKTASEYQRVMLYDVEKLSASSVNKILNSNLQSSNVSFIAIQDPKQPLQPFVADLFPIAFAYRPQEPVVRLMETMAQTRSSESPEGFHKSKFNECVKTNFEIVMQQTEEEGFMKPFIVLLDSTLKQEALEVAQSRWKKMLRVLRFVGVNKHEGNFKRLSLSDFVLAPELLAASYSEHGLITNSVRRAMRLFVPYFGVVKFERSIQNHFFVSPEQKAYYLGMCRELKQQISFFYPCAKFPDTASIEVQGLQEEHPLWYRIRGFQKKLKSDHHIAVEWREGYVLQMRVRANCRMIVHLGVACYDEEKNLIEAVQANRRQNSQVTFEELDGDCLVVSKGDNLANWHQSEHAFAHERAIGVYPRGDSTNIPSLAHVYFNKQEPYSQDWLPYSSIEGNRIRLSQEARHWFVAHSQWLIKGKTVLMNHYDTGGGCIGDSLQMTAGEERQVTIRYGQEGEKQLFPESKYVRVMALVNYNSGYPEYKVENKEGEFWVSEIRWGRV